MTSLLDSFAAQAGYNPHSLTVDQARALVLDTVPVLAAAQRLPVRDALGRVLAADVISPIDVPAHTNSAMDGYALRAADLGETGDTTLTVCGTAFAGRPFEGACPASSCVRIMTGAVLPPSLDTVVMQEAVRADGEQIAIPAGQKKGQNVRHAGEDLRAGAPALHAGRLLTPSDLGLIASLGIAELSVKRRLRVALFSTGDELLSLGEAPRPGAIYDSNRYTIDGMLRRLGCEVIDLGVARDTPEALEAAFRDAAAQADAVITSGGVSVGDADFVRTLMAQLGEVAFWKIAMKPGRPMAFGRIGDAMLFGLPGNPVAVMVTFHTFVRPALMRMMGVDPLPLVPALQAECVTPLKKGAGRTEFQRGVLFAEDGRWKVRLTGAQGSGVLSSMSAANCLVVLEHERGNVAPGETVTVQLLD